MKLLNPRLKGARTMATPTRRELLERISELEEHNEELHEKVDSIAEIVADDETEDDDDSGEE